MRNLLVVATLLALFSPSYSADPWLVLEGGEGPGKGKHIVLVSGDEEYRSEEMLPQLAKILATHHGFKCTVLFAIDPDGTINPNNTKNIPGLEALKQADALILFIRFRDLPDEQMKHFADYFDSGKPVIGLRTSTHAFANKSSKTYAAWHWQSKEKDWVGGLGKKVLGETWVSHWGNHGTQATRGIFAPEQAKNPLLRGIKDGEIFGPTDVYEAHPPKDANILVLGEIVAGMKPTDKAADTPRNKPMMPIVWTKTYQTGSKVGQAFTSTMASSQDFENEAYRRLLVNATYWAVGLEDKIPEKAKVDLVGTYKPSPFKFGGFVKGVKPSDLK
ncbi:MAG: ThuA domain-containing protein [Gemmataceae bacterium]|jgi:hypothetical protein|nr:ThuA domain-containing protein [Gemmataceae bacterium]